MIKFLNITTACLLIWMTSNCSQILQTVDLKVTSEDTSTQEEFRVVEKTLTIVEARKQNAAPYTRTVLQNGRGENAKSIPEKIALISNFPEKNQPHQYKIGIGDTLTFSRLVENNRSPSGIKNKWPIQSGVTKYKLGIGDTLALTIIKDDSSVNQVAPINRTVPENGSDTQNLIINSQKNDVILNSTGRIGSDGSVLLLEVGRLEANGRSLNDLRSEVRNILIRNGVSPRFQLEIVEFKSQRAYLTVSSSDQAAQSSNLIILNDQKTTLVDVLTGAKIAFKSGVITRVKLQRKSKTYQMNLRDIFEESSPEIIIRDGDHIFVEESSTTAVSNVSIVDHDGNVVFEGIGKIKAVGRSLDEIRRSVLPLIQRVPGSQTSFQIDITEFSSQKALVNIPEKEGGIIPIKNQAIPLDEVLTENGLSLDSETITRINLTRNGNTYSFTLDDLINSTSDRIYLQPNDRVTTETFSYKDNKVFVLGGIDPQIFKIKPSNRETLADVLFTEGGVLASASAKRSDVYLLRGNQPVVAYHLDAQSPTRLIVADAMQLRPKDILYVAEQPITSFNRTLATIIPLRILLRDIQDENIP